MAAELLEKGGGFTLECLMNDLRHMLSGALGTTPWAFGEPRVEHTDCGADDGVFAIV